MAVRRKLAGLKPRVPVLDTRRLKPQPKFSDPHYQTPEHRAWRARVIARAGGRCEAIDGGTRCTKAAPEHRMFADHIRELRDGGDPLNLANGQCLCGSHHSLATAERRARRMAV